MKNCQKKSKFIAFNLIKKTVCMRINFVLSSVNKIKILFYCDDLI